MITEGVRLERERTQPIMATRYTPAKDFTCIRNPVRSTLKSIIKEVEKETGKRVTKAQRHRAKRAARMILAQREQQPSEAA